MSTGSVDAHHAADDCPDDAELTDTIVALMSYNIGIHNNELNNKNSWAATYGALQRDIKAAFEHEVGIQILLLSEFGNMFTSFDEKLKDGLEQPTGKTVHSLSELLEDLLANIGLARIRVLADPPYVALIDSRWWHVKEHDVILKLCTKEDIKVVHLILEHVQTKRTPAVFQCSHAR